MMPEKPKQCNIDDFYRLVLNKVSYKHKEIDDALKKVEKLLLNIQDAKTKLAENFTQNFWHFFKHNKKCNKLKTIHNVIDNTCQEIDGPIELYTGLVQIFHQTEAQVNYKSIIELLKECAINFTFIYDKDNSKTEIMNRIVPLIGHLETMKIPEGISLLDEIVSFNKLFSHKGNSVDKLPFRHLFIRKIIEQTDREGKTLNEVVKEFYQKTHGKMLGS